MKRSDFAWLLPLRDLPHSTKAGNLCFKPTRPVPDEETIDGDEVPDPPVEIWCLKVAGGGFTSPQTHPAPGARSILLLKLWCPAAGTAGAAACLCPRPAGITLNTERDSLAYANRSYTRASMWRKSHIYVKLKKAAVATNASCIVAASCSSSGLSLVAATPEDISEGAATMCGWDCLSVRGRGWESLVVPECWLMPRGSLMTTLL